MPIALPRKGRFPTGNTSRKDKQKLFRKQPVGLHLDSGEEVIAISTDYYRALQAQPK